MKNKIKILLFSAVMLLMEALGSQSVLAQNALYEVPGLMTVNSLIREYQPGQDVIFNQDGRSCFLFVDRMAGTVTEAEVRGLNSVADMEVDDEMLYFCGNYGGNQVIGYFDITDLFFGTNTVNFVTVPYAPVVNGYTPTLKLTKLEVLTYSPTDVHVFVLGDVVYGNPQLYTPDFTCLVDAMFDGTIWTVEVISETSGVYFMDDLTVTEYYLVVIGDKHEGTGDYWHALGLPVPGNISLWASNGYPTNIPIYFTSDNLYHPLSRPLIETRTGDKFVVASHGYFEGKYGVVLSLYNTPFWLADRWLVPDVAGAQEFRDLKYNDGTDMLYLIPDRFHSICRNILYSFDLANTQVQAFQTKQPEAYSVDIVHGNFGALVSGMSAGGGVGVWRVGIAECECSHYMDLDVQQTIHQPHMFLLGIIDTTLKSAQYIEIATDRVVVMNLTCGDEEFKAPNQ